ncbi:GerAB/ArcD/ProY family transporter [Paenibacillus methanolicus]|uniref:Spore germination protein (Amino acid permease) n=1 Tax=Paenibacillus methanolicus TaxID=582686 RepID=A0A5S5BNW3_9BACL|nr:GerAB/ArcD/ProY family transporter [Paenibacillus methanolicus]TYP68667.1 spore germination protein (amino acid permease) [Paenibacillus methanolicus]
MSEKLNGYHVAFIIVMIELDVTVFSLPRILAENLGTNGWIGLLLLSAIAFANLGLIHLFHRVGRGRSPFEVAEQSIPRLLLKPAYILLAVFWITIGSFVCKKYVLIYQMVAFPTTNANLLYVLLAALAFYLLIKGIYNIGKAMTIFFYFTVPAALFAFYFKGQWELYRFTPFLLKGGTEGHSLKNWLEVYTIFVGYEISLFLIPFAEPKSLFKGVYFGHSLTTSVYVLLIIVSYGFFSFEQLQAMMYPLLNLFSYIELPFLNRLENLIFTLFLFSNLASLVLFGWMALMALRRAFPKARKNMLELILIAASLGIGSYPKILRDSEIMLRVVLYLETAIAFLLPAVLLVLAVYQARGKTPKPESGTPV